MLVKMGRRHCNGGDGVPSALCEFQFEAHTEWPFAQGTNTGDVKR